MPSTIALVACDICHNKKRLKDSCLECARRKREADKKQKQEERAIKKCTYCRQPAGKVFVSMKFHPSFHDGGMGESTGGGSYWHAELSDPSVVAIDTTSNPEDTTVAHTKCYKVHLLTEAERLESEANVCLSDINEIRQAAADNAADEAEKEVRKRAAGMRKKARLLKSSSQGISVGLAGKR